MELQKGDWVRTEKGDVGRIIIISRLSAFVEFSTDNGPRVVSYLISQLTKIDPPEKHGPK